MARNFAVRLSCSKGDSDTWVTLSDREESLEQVFEQGWDFKCREHGEQRGKPREVIEIAPVDAPPAQTGRSISRAIVSSTKKVLRSSPRLALRIPVVVYGFAGKSGAFHEDTETIMVNASGALVILKAKLQVGDTVFVIHKASRAEQEVRVVYVDRYSEKESRIGITFKTPVPDFWKRTRRKPRVAKTLRVTVKGYDAKGNPFVQSAYTVDLCKDGARLDGVGFLTKPGDTIEVRRHWRKARFKVVWIGQIGTSESNHVGVFGLQSDKDIWHIELPDSHSPPDKNKPPKK